MFKESGNTAVFTTKFVLFDHKEIKWVYHDEEDGTWQFFSDDQFENFEEVAKIVSLDEIVKIDNSLLQLSDMDVGYSAHRNSKQYPWIIEKKISSSSNPT